VFVRYFVSRVVASAVMAVAATVVIFVVAHVVPADPVQAQLGDRASANPEIVAAYRTKWGLDKPLYQQYLIFLKGVFHWDFGMSIATRRPVADDIKQYFPATIELATAAALMTVVIGIPFGILAAVYRDSWVDHVARIISLFGVSAPTFWLAFIVLAIFYGGLKIAPSPGRLDIGAIPPPQVTGMYTIDSILAGDWDLFWKSLSHLFLPATVLAAATIGLITRTTRASMLESLTQDYVRIARAKGLAERVVIMGHVLPNALIPVVTLGGLAYAELLSGTVMTETIFSWPGLGKYSFQSAIALDFPAILAVTFVVALIYLIINLIVDLTYAFLDPRAMQQ
jgi:peptide/nickel transport system permease protein